MHLAIWLGVAGFLTAVPTLLVAAAAAGLVALAAYLSDMAACFRARRARIPDPAMLPVLVALGALALVAIFGMLGLVTRDGGLWAPLPALVLAVFLGSIGGFGQKIWPFMAWLHASHGADARTVPHLAELWPPWIGWATAGGIVAGAGPAALGLLLRAPLMFQAGALMLGSLALGLMVAGGRMLWVARHRRYPVGARVSAGRLSTPDPGASRRS
jgi:hypothetical protein